MNGVNINRFQFEYDLTWMAFFQDAEGRTYARYGGREDGDPQSHLTKASLLKLMSQVLELHQKGAVQKIGRYEPEGQPARTPEDIPPMSTMLAKRKVKCIHCHDVKVAELRDRQARKAFKRDMIFTYPTPLAVGLKLDPDDQGRVKSVSAGSPAAAAGVQTGDRLQSADGERILSLADMARVLELTPKEATLPLKLDRDGKSIQAQLHLSGDWKRTADPSWRASVHLAGPNPGFWGVELDRAQKRAAEIPEDGLALRVIFLFPNHRTPIRAGLKLKDIVIEFDGERHPMSTRHVHALCQIRHDYGDRVPIVVRRNGKDLSLMLELPDSPPPPGND